MKKEVFVLIIACLFIINCLCFVYGASNIAIETPQIEKEVKEVTDTLNVGTLFGFKRNEDISVKNADIVKYGDRTEIVLKEGGEIGFPIIRGKPPTFMHIDANYLDLSKPNKFVFKDGKLVETEFYVKKIRGTKLTGCDTCETSEDVLKQGKTNVLSYVLNGVSFSVPENSKVVLNKGLATITPFEGCDSRITPPGYSSKADLSPFDVSYNSDGKVINFFINTPAGNYLLPLESGNIRYSFNPSFPDDVDTYLVGEEIKFGKPGIKPDSDYTLLEGITIKNKDPDSRTLFIFDSFQRESSPTDYPSISIQAIPPPKDSGITPCIIDCPSEGLHVLGFKVSMNPSPNGESSEVSFSSGNGILPGISENQKITLSPGNSRAVLKTEFYSADEKNKYEVRTEVLAYGEKFKLTNGNDNFEVASNKDGLYWNVPRTSKEANYYPMRLGIAEERGKGIFVSGDTIDVEGKPVTFTKETKLREEDSKEESFDNKLNILDFITKATKIAFGNTASKFVYRRLGDFMFPNSAP